MNKTMSIFAIRLHAHRLQQHIPVAKLAKAAGISKQYLYLIEAGKCPKIGLNIALGLALALGLSIYDLLPINLTSENSCPECMGYREALRQSKDKLNTLQVKLLEIAREI